MVMGIRMRQAIAFSHTHMHAYTVYSDVVYLDKNKITQVMMTMMMMLLMMMLMRYDEHIRTLEMCGSAHMCACEKLPGVGLKQNHAQDLKQ